jgi:hypothetical protein
MATKKKINPTVASIVQNQPIDRGSVLETDQLITFLIWGRMVKFDRHRFPNCFSKDLRAPVTICGWTPGAEVVHCFIKQCSKRYLLMKKRRQIVT